MSYWSYNWQIWAGLVCPLTLLGMAFISAYLHDNGIRIPYVSQWYEKFWEGAGYLLGKAIYGALMALWYASIGFGALLLLRGVVQFCLMR